MSVCENWEFKVEGEVGWLKGLWFCLLIAGDSREGKGLGGRRGWHILRGVESIACDERTGGYDGLLDEFAGGGVVECYASIIPVFSLGLLGFRLLLLG